MRKRSITYKIPKLTKIAYRAYYQLYYNVLLGR